MVNYDRKPMALLLEMFILVIILQERNLKDTEWNEFDGTYSLQYLTNLESSLKSCFTL